MLDSTSVSDCPRNFGRASADRLEWKPSGGSFPEFAVRGEKIHMTPGRASLPLQEDGEFSFPREGRTPGFHCKVKLWQIVHFFLQVWSPRVKMNPLPFFYPSKLKTFEITSNKIILTH